MPLTLQQRLTTFVSRVSTVWSEHGLRLPSIPGAVGEPDRLVTDQTEPACNALYYVQQESLDARLQYRHFRITMYTPREPASHSWFIWMLGRTCLLPSFGIIRFSNTASQLPPGRFLFSPKAGKLALNTLTPPQAAKRCQLSPYILQALCILLSSRYDFTNEPTTKPPCSGRNALSAGYFDARSVPLNRGKECVSQGRYSIFAA